MNQYFKNYRFAWLLAGAVIALLIAYKVIAQAGTAPPIDFDNGPLVAKNQPSNIVLALSVEFPTSGGAYKDGSYNATKEYLGYFNSNRCYTYPGYGSTPRVTATFNVSTDYFSPTGATTSGYECNVGGAGSGFSGNYLNYATMSAPDILRLALTGGDRGIDDVGLTVLDRGTVNSGAQYRRTVAAATVPRVTPFNVGANVYAYNCDDRVIFTTNSGKGCDAPNAGDASDLSPTVGASTASGTTTVTPTVPPFNQVGVVPVDTGTYTSTLPTLAPVVPVTFYTTTRVASANAPFACPSAPCNLEAGGSPDLSVKSASYAASGTATTPAPAGWINSTGLNRTAQTTDTGMNSRDYQGAPAPNVTEVLANNTYICFSPAAPRIIRASSTTGSYSLFDTGSASNVTLRYCTDNGWSHDRLTSTAARTVRNYYSVAYTNYVQTNLYWEYTPVLRYRVYKQQAVWNTYVYTAKAIVKPRPQVCDATEGPTRAVVYGSGPSEFYNFCKKYDTNYKPEGQIQQKSDNLRISVFSYLMDGQNRYGGVMRAPMKYVGANKYDAAGALLANDEKEWSVTTGQFVARPITDTVSTGYAYTGVINYLNRFGKTGNYKTYDNFGELWYESLRYLQGLAPTAASTAGMTEPMKDSYPVYSTWDADPVTSACQRRNYILGIGDTNTHWDRSVPGISRADQVAIPGDGGSGVDFGYNTTPTIKGSAAALDAHTWTQIMDGFERNNAAAIAFTDSLGRARTTAGFNSTRNGGIGNLDTANTGSGGRSTYHWAGLSYWANTQAIRKDVKGGASMDQVRVKTFMIDVDENNQGSVNAAIKNTAYYLAGKYGYFDDTAQTGNPFLGNNETSAWADAAGAPKGYVLASQPQRLVAGIKQFFDDSTGGGNSFSTVAVSNSALSAASPDGKTFEPSFIPGEWSGTVKSVELKLNTTTNTLETGNVLWDAGKILTDASRETGVVALPAVKPADRKIIAYIDGSTPKAVTFTFAGTNNGLDLPASFNNVPYTGTSDSQAEARINFLRGDRAKEVDESFRARQSVLGDIINSGPVYKAGANPRLSGLDYPAFVTANKTRTPVVYTGSNDGMLHAFKADTGQELFAYIPGGALTRLPNLTSKSYIHELFVDAVPAVDEVRGSSGWKTVLASGLGGGGQGIFALDVTNPTAFDKSKVMFEFTDKDDPHMGNVTSAPQFVKMLVPGSSPATYKYYIVVSSGYNNYKNDGTGRYVTTPDQALFFLDVDKSLASAWAEGTNYFKVILPAKDTTKVNGLAAPGIRLGNAQEGIEFFAGDMQGNVWKVAFPNGLSTTKIADAVYKNGSNVKTPLFTARDTDGNIQSISSAPVIYPYRAGGNMVVFGTGRLLESVDRSTTATHSIYGVWDSGQSEAANFGIVRAKLDQMTVDVTNATTSAISGTTSSYSNSSAKRGWFFELPRSKERIVVDPVTAAGVVQFSSTIPPSSECSDNGNSYVYFLNPQSGLLVTAIEGGTGYFGKGIVLDIDTSTSSSSSYSDRNVSGSRTATKKVAITVPGAGGAKITKYFDVTYLRTGRVYWREVRDFNLVN